jgi:predicted DsbA family dithiol-disulfide isomerase
MYLITTKNCSKCKMLRQMLGDKYFFLEVRDAEDEMGTCRRMGIKSVPALVFGEEAFTTELDAIVDVVEDAFEKSHGEK